jgi:23S rRNA-/tRNA-specific pseudouridylate synthase
MKDNKTPILGDRKYGVKDGYRNMLLEANRIFFVHPITRQRIDIKLDIPSLYLNIFKEE